MSRCSISGPAVLGVALELHESRLQEVLDLLRTIPPADQVVLVAGSSTGLELWFEGPWHAGDFLTHWCANKNDLSRAKNRALSPESPSKLSPSGVSRGLTGF